MININLTKNIYPRLVKGFTLIELLIVIAIIAILVGIVVVAINPAGLIDDSNDSKRRQEMQQLKNSLQLYFNDFNRYPVPATEFLVSNCADCLSPVYTREIPEEFLGASPTAIYEDTPAGEYRAGIVMSERVTNGNDDGSFTLCDEPNPPGFVPTTVGTVWLDADYFICPD